MTSSHFHSGAWLCATAYGCVVIKSLAGDEVAAALLFSKGWPIGHFGMFAQSLFYSD